MSLPLGLTLEASVNLIKIKGRWVLSKGTLFLWNASGSSQLTSNYFGIKDIEHIFTVPLCLSKLFNLSNILCDSEFIGLGASSVKCL